MYRPVLILFLMLLFTGKAKPANDSLLDTATVTEYINLSYKFGWNSPDSMIANATRALAMSEKINYQKGLFLSYEALGSARYVTGDFGKGLAEAKNAIDIARKN